MRKLRLISVSLFLSLLFTGCNKNNDDHDLTEITLGEKSLGIFTPSTQIAYKRPEGYIIKLSSDTVDFTMLLTKLKIGHYTITNTDLAGDKTNFHINFNSTSYGAFSGSIEVTDTSDNSITGIYSSIVATRDGDQLKISNGRFTKLKITSLTYGTVSDYEHNQYKTIIVGSQTWMAENLKSRIYANGDSIKEVFRYSNNDHLANIYGLLYTFKSATHNINAEMTQGACPVGWHLPSNSEWKQLIDNLGGEAIAGGKMKSLTSWGPVNACADNSSGFSALSAGMHYPEVEISNTSERMGSQTFFLSSSLDTTIVGISLVWSITLETQLRNVLRHPYNRGDMGYSIRCVKN